MAISLIRQYESAIAGYLERSLKGTKIRLWADVFSSNDNARQKAQLYFGLQSVAYDAKIFNPETQRYDRRKLLTFEVQALVQTLHNHQEALDLIDEAMTALDNYCPFVEAEAIELIRYGNTRFNRENGSWLYSGECRSALWSVVQSLTAIEEVAAPQIVQIGLFNGGAIAPNDSDRVWGAP